MQIVWSLFAIEDREAIFAYIQVDSPRAAARIDDLIEAQIELLASYSEIGRAGRVSGTREPAIQRTPYLAAYRVEAESLRVLRVLHGSQLWPDEFERGVGLWGGQCSMRQCRAVWGSEGQCFTPRLG